MAIDYTKDGIEHINVSINGNTELGKRLSMEYYRPFVDPVSKKSFISLYQFYVWLNSGKEDSILSLEGWEKFPSLMTNSMFGFAETDSTKTEMVECVKRVISNDKSLVKVIIQLKLPLMEYHVIKTSVGEMVINATRPWFIKALTNN
jgi:hypothetical protein